MTVPHQPRPVVTRAGRVFYNVVLCTALVVGALQMYHVHGGVVTNYGADVFGTAWLYAMTRSGRTIFQRGRVLGAGTAVAIVFVLCVGSEFGQKLHVVPGHYDPYDIAAYAITLIACWIIDHLVPFVGASS